MTDPRNETLFKLAELRESLKTFMKPEILSKFGDLLEALGDQKSFVQQYKFWIEKNGQDCRYAAFSKEFFLRDHAKSVAKSINYLYHNWARFYEEK